MKKILICVATAEYRQTHSDRDRQMKKEHFDVIVLGVGGMGSAALYALSKRGLKVCGVDRFGVAHDQGSSHGEIRMIRKAYFEHPDYVNLLHHAYEQWENLEQESGQKLMEQVGAIIIGNPNLELIRGQEECYRQHSLPHERLSADEIRQRFPQVSIREDQIGYFDPLAGFVYVERGVSQMIRLAQEQGATFYPNEEVKSWQSNEGNVVVRTNQRELTADKLVLSLGAWSAPILEEIGVHLAVHRKVQFWFDAPDLSGYRLGELPCFFKAEEEGACYGFPVIDNFGIKAAEHTITREQVKDPLQIDRKASLVEEKRIQSVLDQFFSRLTLRKTKHAVCMYTMSPDENFILDLHPQFSNVVFAAGFSGHGYKFAPTIGEILADLAIQGETSLPIDFLKLGNRFSS